MNKTDTGSSFNGALYLHKRVMKAKDNAGSQERCRRHVTLHRIAPLIITDIIFARQKGLRLVVNMFHPNRREKLQIAIPVSFKDHIPVSSEKKYWKVCNYVAKNSVRLLISFMAFNIYSLHRIIVLGPLRNLTALIAWFRTCCCT